MPVYTRIIQSSTCATVPVLGAVKTAAGTLAAFPSDTDVASLKDLQKIETGRGALAYVPENSVQDAADAELDFLQNKRVLLALRNAETPEAAADWLGYHHTRYGVGGAVIFNRAQPNSDGFAAALEHALGLLDVAVLVVEADTPLGRKDGPDARDPAFAPALRNATAAIEKNRWHASLGELTLYELLRHRFLASAKSVALLDIADFLLPDKLSAFELAESNNGRVVPLLGTEVYPWRLRQGQPAPFADHIAKRRGEKRQLLSWCAAPAALPAQCVWQPGRPLGAAPSEDSARFARALGVVFPKVAVENLVKKADLVEDTALVALSASLGHTPIRLPSAAVIPPRPAQGRFTLVSAMKNEGPFILDWIAHNQAIGVNNFLIYTNDCEDGTDTLLGLLGEAGVIHRDNPFRKTGQVPQYAAFSAAEDEQVVRDADWIMTLDVDEYINIHAGSGNLQDLLDAAPDAHVISMPWRLFGNNDIHHFEDVPVSAQFTMAAPEYMPRPYQAWAFKSLYRNAGLFRRLGVHRPKGLQSAYRDAILWVTGSGKEFAQETWRSAWRVGTSNWGYDLVTLNHYAVRSAESFLVKRDRGRVNHVHEHQDEAYWFRMNHNVEEETSIQRLAARTQAIKDDLLALPGVAEAHARAVVWHKTRIASLKGDAQMRAFYEQITSRRMERLSRFGPRFGMQVFIEGPHVVPDEVLERDPADNFFFSLNPPAATR